MYRHSRTKAASGICRFIISMMPPHDTYIETHLGSGDIMRRKPPASNNIAIDLNLDVLRSFNCDYYVKKVNGCAHKFIKTYNFLGCEMVYCDPPYLLYNHFSVAPKRFIYKEQDHIELLELLKGLPCSVMISGAPTTLYDNLLKDWGNLELQVMSHNCVRTEKLWFNFTPDGDHWARSAGKNTVDRQRIKRKAQSWGNIYQALPRGERIAVLSEVMNVEAQDAE